ncbi:MAG: EFR1 family ferrodoxin [Methanobacteriota archaeon]
MKTTIYYFSGTGNSLVAARKIAGLLGDAELIPIATLRQSGTITALSGRIGIICPVYDMGIPVIVRDFLQNLVVDKSTYLFAILTLGGQGAAALKLINTCLREKNKRVLSAGFLVKMPGNFPPVGVPPTGKKRDTILASAEKELDRIGEHILKKKENSIGFTPFSSLLQSLLYGSFSKGVHSLDEKFTVSEACTSCGTCASVCPTGNITIIDGRPVWNHQCELCCGCLNFCPVEAINLHMMLGTKGRGRYHHPDITVSDLKGQQGKLYAPPTSG